MKKGVKKNGFEKDGVPLLQILHPKLLPTMGVSEDSETLNLQI